MELGQAHDSIRVFWFYQELESYAREYSGSWAHIELEDFGRVIVYSVHNGLMNTIDWLELLPVLKLSGNQENIFSIASNQTETLTHIRFNIYPDGGVSRLRIIGRPVP